MYFKQVLKELFSSKSSEYWKNEGCNNRMRKYNFIKQILYVLQQILMLFTVIYFVFISSKAIVNIFDIRMAITSFDQLNIKEVEKFIFNIYQVSFVLLIVFNLINCKINSIPLLKAIKDIIKGLLVFPVIALIMFYFILIGNLMISFWILVVFIILDTVIDFIVKRINFLYAVSIGKEKEKNGKK